MGIVKDDENIFLFHFDDSGRVRGADCVKHVTLLLKSGTENALKS